MNQMMMMSGPFLRLDAALHDSAEKVCKIVSASHVVVLVMKF